jgi:hypothetical protein
MFNILKELKEIKEFNPISQIIEREGGRYCFENQVLLV